ncbi:DUF3987 domain-containing protein, partial [Okeania sp. SIO1H2]|uniref:DUF3987 domain-containing protein n=1 Tax=Okeania sp. SIO1H2 TaxID=2607775 RepID=UPI00141D1CD5
GLLAGADQYKKAKGNFRNTLLTAMSNPINGTEERSQNGDDTEIIFKDHVLCISGSIQPSRIQSLFDPRSDDSGLGSRFLCAYPKLPDDFHKWSHTQVNVYEELQGVLKYLQDIGEPEEDPITCTLDRKTQRQFIRKVEAFKLLQKNNTEVNPGLAAFIGKCPGHLARLVLLSHWICCYFEEEQPGIVTQVAYDRGEHLINYYIGQFKLLQVQVAGPEALSKIQMYLYERLKKTKGKKSLSVRQGYTGIRANPNVKNLSMDEVRDVYTYFEKRGLAELKGDELWLPS